MASVELGNMLETAFNWIECKIVLAIVPFFLCVIGFDLLVKNW